MAGIHRERVVYFAGKHNWDKAYRSAARSKKSQVMADQHFEFYLDTLARDEVSKHTCTSYLRPELDCSLNPCDAVKADRIS